MENHCSKTRPCRIVFNHDLNINHITPTTPSPCPVPHPPHLISVTVEGLLCCLRHLLLISSQRKGEKQGFVLAIYCSCDWWSFLSLDLFLDYLIEVIFSDYSGPSCGCYGIIWLYACTMLSGTSRLTVEIVQWVGVYMGILLLYYCWVDGVMIKKLCYSIYFHVRCSSVNPPT